MFSQQIEAVFFFFKKPIKTKNLGFFQLDFFFFFWVGFFVPTLPPRDLKVKFLFTGLPPANGLHHSPSSPDQQLHPNLTLCHYRYRRIVCETIFNIFHHVHKIPETHRGVPRGGAKGPSPPPKSKKGGPKYHMAPP